MKTISFLIVILTIGMLSLPPLKAQSEKIEYHNINYYYDSLPDIKNCYPGKLKDKEKQKVLYKINQIRSILGLRNVIYDVSLDGTSSNAALMCSANSEIDRTKTNFDSCYNLNGYSFLRDAYDLPSSLIGYDDEDSVLSTIESIKIWFNDINGNNYCMPIILFTPYLYRISFGRIDGEPKVKFMNKYVTTSLLNFSWAGYTPDIDWNGNFVAWPQGHYPIEYFDTSGFMSFYPFILIKDQSGYSIQHLDIYYSTLRINDSATNQNIIIDTMIQYNYYDTILKHYYTQLGMNTTGAIKWKIRNLQVNKTYHVSISGVYGIPQGPVYSFNYYFRLVHLLDPPWDAPILVTPKNGTLNLLDTVKLFWDSTFSSNRYIINISKDLYFKKNLIINDSNNVGLNYQFVNPEPNTTYYWRVQAVNSGGSSPWSATWNFKTGVEKTATPTLIEPKNDSSTEKTPQLIWSMTDNVLSYHLQIGNDNQFQNNIVTDSEYYKETYSVSSGLLEFNKDYYWRVRAMAYGMRWSDWSEVWKFKTSIAGVNGYKDESIFAITPIPAKDYIELTAIKFFNKIEIYNSMGEILSTLGGNIVLPADVRQRIDISVLSPGLYFCAITQKNERKILGFVKE